MKYTIRGIFITDRKFHFELDTNETPLNYQYNLTGNPIEVPQLDGSTKKVAVQGVLWVLTPEEEK